MFFEAILIGFAIGLAVLSSTAGLFNLATNSDEPAAMTLCVTDKEGNCHVRAH